MAQKPWSKTEKKAEQEYVGPDPLWPMGAEPTHLPPAERADALINAAFMGTSVDSFTCKRCGTHLNRSSGDPSLCGECYAKEAKNTQMARKMNGSWMEIAEEAGLALYERQPEETDEEWRIWCTYRDHYPLKLPTWSELAKECSVSPGTILRISGRWSFKVRMQAWARASDDATAQQRIEAVKEMNKRQVDMSMKLQEKLAKAIDQLDPALLRPGEIVNLLKASTELERRIKLATPEKVDGTVQVAGAQQKKVTKTEDLGEVLQILSSSGLLPGQKVAVEQTTTTRILAAGAEEPKEEVIVI